MQIFKSLKQTMKLNRPNGQQKPGKVSTFSLLCTYRDLRAKKHRDKNSLLALKSQLIGHMSFFQQLKTTYRRFVWLYHYFH